MPLTQAQIDAFREKAMELESSVMATIWAVRDTLLEAANEDSHAAIYTQQQGQQIANAGKAKLQQAATDLQNFIDAL